MSMTDFKETPMVSRSYNRGYRDGAMGRDLKDQFEQTSFDRDAYRAGYVLGRKMREEKSENRPASTGEELADQIIEKVDEARKMVIDRLMSNPGFVATFGNNPVIEFGDLDIWDKNDSTEFNPLEEYRFQMALNVRISVRKEGEIDEYDRVYGNRRVEALRKLRENLAKAEADQNQEEVVELRKTISVVNQELSERGLRMTEEGNLEST